MREAGLWFSLGEGLGDETGEEGGDKCDALKVP